MVFGLNLASLVRILPRRSEPTSTGADPYGHGPAESYRGADVSGEVEEGGPGPWVRWVAGTLALKVPGRAVKQSFTPVC